jgi:hypothetical protein
VACRGRQKTLRKNAPLERDAERRRFALLQLLHVVETLDEDQVGDLLDHLQRIGEAARPEIIPDARRSGCAIHP